MKTVFGLMLMCISLTSINALNQCAQYGSCNDCLNVTAGHPSGGRPDCGWCHTDIAYQNGTTGARCADIRDDPWKCRDAYDT